MKAYYFMIIITLRKQIEAVEIKDLSTLSRFIDTTRSNRSETGTCTVSITYTTPGHNHDILLDKFKADNMDWLVRVANQTKLRSI